MKRLTISLLLACSCLGVDSAWLNTLAQVESSGNPASIGDGGKARGLFQMHQGAWTDATAIRKRQGKSVWPYSDAFDAVKAREYARTYADALESRLERSLGRPAKPSEVWCAWNMGYAAFQRVGFDVSMTPTTTQKAAKRFK